MAPLFDDPRIDHLFPFLHAASPALHEAIATQAVATTLPAGAFVCMEGNACAHLPLVLEGNARVYKLSDDGRPITLYRIRPGESCILTASCILSDRLFPAFAEAETDVDALVIPAPLFQDWFDQFRAWRTYVFDLLSRRLTTVIELVEEVAFHRVDERLAAYLAEAGASATRLERTHEHIAADLGTSREVVSRILKEFEHRGWVALTRGVVHLRDVAALATMSTP